MTNPAIGVDVSGGQIQGIVGAGSVIIENLTFYGQAPADPGPSANGEPIGTCPYPGLAYFGPGDADMFFGRDAAITRLVDAVGRQSLTALVGASGSGKSSVVLAGLAPRLHRAGGWRFSHFRIGTELNGDPFMAMSRALTPLYAASESDVERLKNTKLLAASLKEGSLTLRDVFSDARSRNKDVRILLIADQFEEVFTLINDDVLRDRFVEVLVAGFEGAPPGRAPDICLLLTMRADFYGHALRYRQLADTLQNRVENLGPMRREELQATIVSPAELAGVTFESGLVETLLDAVQDKPGGLPLLQFSLREMWGRQERKKITRKSYDEIGGVEGALAQHAEFVFASVTNNGRNESMERAFQRLFTRLVTPGVGQEDTRRVVERSELGDEVWWLAQRLAGEENRLVVTNVSAARETVEVIHEALIRHWPRLVEWINRDRALQTWLRQIKSNVDVWLANRDDDGALLRGGMLAQATDWLAKRRGDLSQKELEFIEASVALRQRLDAEKEAARQAEIASAKRLADEQRRRAKVAFRLGGLAGLAAIASVAFAIVAAMKGEEARNARSVAEDQARQAITTERGLDLAQRGWGVIFAEELNSDLRGRLQKLLDHRRKGAGSKYLEITNRSGETAGQMLARYGADCCALDPIPYYLLIVGSPQQIPYSVQYELASNHAVGRIFFEQPEQYAAYASNVVAAETNSISEAPRAVLFGTRHKGDAATKMTVTGLLQPIAASFDQDRKSWTSFDWSLTGILGEQATKSKLSSILTSEKPPALLFIASHGMGSSKNSPDPEERNGAIVCAEWPGFGAVENEMIFSASDTGPDFNLRGSIIFAFVSNSAGTPRYDEFDMSFPIETRKELFEHDLMSRLPMRWLGVPDRGALAFIGHVDRNWAFSIVPTKMGDGSSRPAPGLFSQTLRLLMNGYTIGLAMDSFRRRFALNATLLTSQLAAQLPPSGSRELVNNRLATIDIRNYVIIGDPAVSSPARRKELQ